MLVFVTGRSEAWRFALKMFLQNRPDLDVVGEANDIRNLLAKAEATRTEIILIDWDMCDQPLPELVTALHLLESRPGLILINAPIESRQAALAAGVDACVVKGAPPKSLLLAIESVRLMRGGVPFEQ